MRAVLLVVALLFGGYSFAALYPPSPTPSIANSKPPSSITQNKKDSESNKLETKGSPVVIEIAKPSVSQVETSIKTEVRRDYFSPEWSLVYITVALALITGALAFYTGKLYRATVRLGKDAKETAENSTHSMIASERAYIFIEFILEEPIVSSSLGAMNTVHIKLWNNGKTPAEIIMIRAYQVIDNTAPDILTEFEGSDRELPPGLGIAKDCAYDVPVAFSLTDIQRQNIEGWNTKLFFVGNIRYRDVFGNLRDTGFCWQALYHMSKYRFIPSQDSKLNKRT